MKNPAMKPLSLTLAGLLALAAQPLLAGQAGADEVREHLVTMARPNQLYIIDPEAREVVRTCDVEGAFGRSEEHTSELQSRPHLVCRLLLEKKNLHRKRML